MKKRCLALLLAVFVLLSGCAAMLERGYSSSNAHVDYSVTEDSSILRTETYQGLVSAILYFINEHSTQGTIRLYNYTGDAQSDLASAREEVLQRDPLGSYAVAALEYTCTQVLSYYEVTLEIRYRYSADAVAAIQSVTGMSGLRQELNRLVTSNQRRAVVRVSYFSGDAALVEDLFWLAYYNDPSSAVHPTALSPTVRLYPETGTQRIVEITSSWSEHSSAAMVDYARQLSDLCAQIMEYQPPAEEHYTVAELAALLGSCQPLWDAQGQSTALAALSGEAVNDLGLLLAMEYLCLQASIEASMVIGSDGSSHWLIVSTPDGYRHLLPQSLHPGSDTQPLPPVLYTDTQLRSLGYDWPELLHPACVDEGSASVGEGQ